MVIQIDHKEVVDNIRIELSFKSTIRISNRKYEVNYNYKIKRLLDALEYLDLVLDKQIVSTNDLRYNNLINQMLYAGEYMHKYAFLEDSNIYDKYISKETQLYLCNFTYIPLLSNVDSKTTLNRFNYAKALVLLNIYIKESNNDKCINLNSKKSY